MEFPFTVPGLGVCVTPTLNIASFLNAKGKLEPFVTCTTGGLNRSVGLTKHRYETCQFAVQQLARAQLGCKHGHCMCPYAANSAAHFAVRLSTVDFHKLRLVVEEFGKRSAKAQVGIHGHS